MAGQGGDHLVRSYPHHNNLKIIGVNFRESVDVIVSTFYERALRSFMVQYVSMTELTLLGTGLSWPQGLAKEAYNY